MGPAFLGSVGEGNGEGLVGVPARCRDLDLEGVGTREVSAELGAQLEVEDLGGGEGRARTVQLGGGDLDGLTGAARRVPASPPGGLSDGPGLRLGEENESAEDQHGITSVLYAVDAAGFGADVEEASGEVEGGASHLGRESRIA